MQYSPNRELKKLNELLTTLVKETQEVKKELKEIKKNTEPIELIEPEL